MSFTTNSRVAGEAGGAERIAVSTVLKDGLRSVVPVFSSVIVFSFFINLLLFVSPLYMLQIYDRVISSRSEPTLIALTILAAVLILVYALLEMLRSRLLVRAGLVFDTDLAEPVFDAVHRGNVKQPSGGHTQCLRDVDTLREFLTGTGLVSFCDVPWFPIFVFASYLLHPYFGALALLGTVLILALTLANELATKKHLQASSAAAMRAQQSVLATQRNAEVVQAMGMVSAMRRKWAVFHADALELQATASDRAGFIVAWTKFFRMFLQTCILGLGALLVIQREISAGQMIAASILIGRAMQPIEGAIANWKGFVAARSALGRVRSLFNLVGDAPARMSLPRPRGLLQVSELIAGAPGGRQPILLGVSFELEAGEIVGIVGPSAAGKSSLVRVLAGIWPAMRGSVRLDGSELNHWDPEELGRHVGYLPQDIELFSGTVAENIARFQALDTNAIIAAAQLAGCHELIQQLPLGYNTPLGEGGQSLSGGQKQRVGLARALYDSPSFVILDEPNSNLDGAGEEALLAAVQRLREHKTTVVIVTHKINILAAVDKILIMASGAVQAFGRREVILQQLTGPRVVPTSSAQGPAPGSGSKPLNRPTSGQTAQKGE